MYDNSANGLLEELRQRLRYEYISDLHNHPHSQQLIVAATQIPAQRYSLNAWTQAVHYITGKTPTFSSMQEAHTFLLRWGQSSF